ncbi:MAG TPA: hypothetical protein VFK41_03090 [Nocardioidaceae bacterium]|nr:hypothetical protein [Nocardioidaceae bacterium]
MALLKPRTRTVPLFQGDDRVRITELQQAVEAAVTREGLRRVGDGSETLTAAEEYDAFVLEATGRAVKVELQQLRHKLWRKLVLANPPRDDEEDDKEYGFDIDAMAEALLPYVDDEDPEQRTIISPQFETREALQEFIDDLSHGDFQRLYSAAYLLNVDSGGDPKADMSSRLARISDATSSSPARLG